MDTTEHLTVTQIMDAVYRSEIPAGDPDDHDMLVRLADEITRLRREVAQLTAWPQDSAEVLAEVGVGPLADYDT